jgi:hypothetical protein
MTFTRFLSRVYQGLASTMQAGVESNNFLNDEEFVSGKEILLSSLLFLVFQS